MKSNETLIDYGNGNQILFLHQPVSIEKLKQDLSEATEAYRKSPGILNKLDWMSVKADYMFRTGKDEDAAKFLEKELASIHEISNSHEFLTRYLGVLESITEILICIKRPDDALKYANWVMEICDNHFHESVEYAYGEHLYACVCLALGRKDQAKDYLEDALSRLKDELDTMKRIKEDIEESLRTEMD